MTIEQTANNPKNQPTSQNDLLIDQLFELMVKVQQQEERSENERNFLLRETENPAIVDLLQNLTVTALHVIDAIGQHEPVNGIQVARRIGVTKGGVSKITQRLLDQQIITKESLPTNKKDVYFRLTGTGRELFYLHQTLHSQLEQKARSFLANYSAADLEILVRFFNDYLENQ